MGCGHIGGCIDQRYGLQLFTGIKSLFMCMAVKTEPADFLSPLRVFFVRVKMAFQAGSVFIRRGRKRVANFMTHLAELVSRYGCVPFS
jgi:hypothetical protein